MINKVGISCIAQQCEEETATGIKTCWTGFRDYLCRKRPGYRAPKPWCNGVHCFPYPLQFTSSKISRGSNHLSFKV